MTRSKKKNIRSLTNYILKIRFLVNMRYLFLKGCNIPDGEGKQGIMQLMRGIMSKTMQEIISHTSIYTPVISVLLFNFGNFLYGLGLM